MCDSGSDCCRTTAKVLLIIINLIFFLAGLLMLAFGIALVAAPWKIISILSKLGTNEFDAFSQSTDGYFTELIKACGIFMIILGGVVAIVAFFGFFGACCESKCMLITYAVILIIVVLAEVALIIFGAVFPDKFMNTGKSALYRTLKNDFHSDYIATQGQLQAGNSESGWHVVQMGLECCGVENYTDYMDASKANWTRAKCDGVDCVPAAIVPLSCCKVQDSNNKIAHKLTDFIDYRTCLQTASDATTHRKGCVNAAKDFILDYSKIAIGIAAGIAGLELILIALAFIMVCMWGDRSGKYV